MQLHRVGQRLWPSAAPSQQQGSSNAHPIHCKAVTTEQQGASAKLYSRQASAFSNTNIALSAALSSVPAAGGAAEVYG